MESLARMYLLLTHSVVKKIFLLLNKNENEQYKK
jgi:hypothetical protein